MKCLTLLHCLECDDTVSLCKSVDLPRWCTCLRYQAWRTQGGTVLVWDLEEENTPNVEILFLDVDSDRVMRRTPGPDERMVEWATHLPFIVPVRDNHDGKWLPFDMKECTPPPAEWLESKENDAGGTP